MKAGWLYFSADLDQPGEPLRRYTNTLEIDTPPGDANPGDNYYEDVAFSGGEVRRVEFWLHRDDSADIWGEAVPDSAITVTTPYSQVYAWADPECGGCWNVGDRVELRPGDAVTVEAGAAIQPVSLTVPDPFFAYVDTNANEVAGQIGGWSERPVEVYDNWSGGFQEVTSDPAGNFLAPYSDIPPGADGYVRFVDQIDYAEVIFHRSFWAPDLILDINYGHDWVAGSYEPGHTVWITVTEGDGATVKGLAELHTDYIPEWDNSGFSTNQEGWLGDQPDIQSFDWIYARADNGYTNTTQIGDVEFTVDYEADVVAGVLGAPWVPGPQIPLRCELWGHPDDPGIDLLVTPAGGPILCDFGAGGWDIGPGQSVGVMYWEPDGDQIMNAFDWPRITAGIGPWSGGDRHVWGHGARPNGSVAVTVTTEAGAFVAGATTTADDRGNWDTGNDLPRRNPGLLECNRRRFWQRSHRHDASLSHGRRGKSRYGCVDDHG